MSFRQRMGLDLRDVLQIDTMDTKTKNLLYNVVEPFMEYERDDFGNLTYISRSLSLQIANLLEDRINSNQCYEKKFLSDIFDDYDYSYIYSMLEFVYMEIEEEEDEEFIEMINEVLEREKCNYLMNPKGEFIKVSDGNELELLEKASTSNINPVDEHMKNAITEYSQRTDNINYDTVCHEAIKAVESLAKSVLGDSYKDKTLSQCKGELRDQLNIPPFVMAPLDKIWEMSNQEGIRHGKKETSDAIIIGEPEAYYILMTCSSFINYVLKIQTKK